MRRLWYLAVLSLPGCVYASGFDRGALHAYINREPMQVTEDDVHKALELRPQIAFPCKIAIYLYDPGNGYQWRWTPKDKEQILSWMESLKRDGIVSDAFIMSGMFASGSSMKEVRLAAAQHGGDAVLVLKGAYQTDSYYNLGAALNLTIVGAFVVPASHRDTLFIMQGGLIDVANGFLYASVESEGEGSIIRPAYFVEEKDAIEPARKQALERLGPELTRRLRNLQGAGGPQAVYLAPPRIILSEKNKPR